LPSAIEPTNIRKHSQWENRKNKPIRGTLPLGSNLGLIDLEMPRLQKQSHCRVRKYATCACRIYINEATVESSRLRHAKGDCSDTPRGRLHKRSHQVVENKGLLFLAFGNQTGFVDSSR